MSGARVRIAAVVERSKRVDIGGAYPISFFGSPQIFSTQVEPSCIRKSMGTQSPASDSWPRSLLDGFRAGDKIALTEVYQRHGREVASMLRSGFSFSSGGRQHRFVGYRSSFELQDTLHET